MDGPVVVVGAGLAGLACARRLHAVGRDVLVLEAADEVGGRVRTDLLDGFRCDRGFQLLNPAYPEVRRVVDLTALRLRSFDAGVVVATQGHRLLLGDPRRLPASLPGTLLRAGTPREKLALVRWALPALGPVDRLLALPDEPLRRSLDEAGVHGEVRTVVDTFLAGVLGEDDGSTSATFARLLVRSFALGLPSLPEEGMGALPAQLAVGLPPGSVRTGVRVRAVRAGDRPAVETDDGTVPAAAVVLAADPVTAADLIGVRAPVMHGLTTFWHAARQAPTSQRLLHLDGDRSGPIVNTAVVTAVAPSYAPAGRHLVASTVLGAHGDAGTERAVREQAGRVYGCSTADWETVTVSEVPHALPAQEPPLRRRRRVRLGDGLYVAGDHRDTASIQGALVSGRRAAEAVLVDASVGVRRR